jgi:hypothetical protein
MLTRGLCALMVPLAIAILGVIGDSEGAAVAEAPVSRQVKDYDSRYFERALSRALDRRQPASQRLSALNELVTSDAERAQSAIAGLLRDTDPSIRRTAGEWLAILGDPTGLEQQAQCLQDSQCSRRHHSARLLGASGRVQYAPVLANQIRKILDQNFPGGVWQGRAEDRALLFYSTIGLARIGRAQDRDLILDAVSRRPHEDAGFLEALGYVNDPRSRELLWNAYAKLQRTPSCDHAGLGVPALIPLSRLGEPVAIQRMKDILKGVGTPPDSAPANSLPSLCADRGQAFDGLRTRDAAHFAETVFEVAAHEPEGPGTREAWRALGIMHPRGFGDRVLREALGSGL